MAGVLCPTKGLCWTFLARSGRSVEFRPILGLAVVEIRLEGPVYVGEHPTAVVFDLHTTFTRTKLTKVFLFLQSLALVALLAAVEALTNDNIDITVDVDKDSKTYHQFKTREGSFNYGYNVAKQNFNQFQHKVRGPDDVTYGCYGFVDPKNGTHLYHYVSDLKGYRVVPPNKPTKIYRQRVAESVKQLLEAVEENLPWDRLYFPEVCRYLYLSHKQSNKFVLPPDVVVNEDGSVTKETPAPTQAPREVPPPRPAPARPTAVETGAKITPDASQQQATTASRPAPPRAPIQYSPPAAPVTAAPTVRQTRPTTTTPRPTVASNRAPAFINQQPQGQSFTPVRVAPAPAPATPRPVAPPTTAAPKRISNDFTGSPSKIVAKPIESKPIQKPSLEVRRPNEPQATTYRETVLPSGKPQDLDAIHQDVREVKASLKKLLDHIFSRKADCDTPHSRAPNGVHPGAAVTPTGHVTAYLPLVLADFPAGASAVAAPAVHSSPVATVPLTGAHPSGTVKLALPALPAYQPPQCPVCRSDSFKK
ncbi:uncharacterized protein LOC115263539 [Aedes albopictus]|uniref:Uncharacterized protein n=1 Tax=Aedes albopictus TaxID=7160 RepID=A0ABM1Z021_AEDAL